MKALFGGDGMPDPPNIATPEGSPLAGDPDSLLSKANPSGNEEDTNTGTPNVVTPSNTHGKRLPWSPGTELSPVQEGYDDDEEKEKDEMKDAKFVMMMEVEEYISTCNHKSLASVSGKTQYSTTMGGNEAGPTCHQTMEEEFTGTNQLEVNEMTVDENLETAMILPSEGNADLMPLKQYQLKMLTNKKNAMNQLIEVVNYMLKEDLCMEIMAYDLWNGDSNETPNQGQNQ
jgi:hypothetical protein